MKETNTKRKVILNKMFPNAAYMTTYENIGHETINLFRANDGYYYIHLNPNGTCNLDNVDVLNLSKIGNGLWRVMSKAVNCKRLDAAKIFGKDKNQLRYDTQMDKDNICYGYYANGEGITVDKYFERNVTMKGEPEKDLFATFKCDGVYKPKYGKPIFISVNDCKTNYDHLKTHYKYYQLKNINKWGSACRIINIFGDDLTELQKIIADDNLWMQEPLLSFQEQYDELKNNSGYEEENYFTFLGVEKQELQYSNALVKILKFNSDFLSDFLSNLSGDDCKNNKFEILREEKSIDLLFRDLDKKNGKIFVIENKIDANVTLSEEKMKVEEQVEKWIKKMENITDEEWSQDQLDIKNKILSRIVNKKDNLTSQLSKYYVIAVYWALKNGWDNEKISKDVHCYFLCPEYHKYNYKVNNEGFLDSNFALSGMYKLITYKKIKEIFDNFSKDNLSDHQRFLFDDFISAISALAKARDDSMELKMIKMFIDRYNEIKVEQHK